MPESNITSEKATELITGTVDSSLSVVGDSLEWVTNNQGLLIEYGMNIAAAILTLAIGLFAARLISGGFHKVLTKRKLDNTVIDFATGMVRYVVIAFVVIAALSRIGVQTTSFIALIGAAGLAVGLALQGSLSNFASGILIVILRPFKAGEYIEAAGTAGSVASVQIFATTLTTPDNKFVVVPNSAILSGNIVNYSRMPTRRIDLIIGVSYGADLAKTKALLERVVKANSDVLETPAPLVAVAELGDSSVNLVVRPWVNCADYWKVRFALMEAIKNGLDEEGIEIPFPQMDVHMDK
ncbi:MAG: small conductance mechanosensitive channel [Psychromonas sp.]|jgi:small conductance mechanosensitive channel|uniref:mechanosensitive ion channel domain-containing protein n=1 Tax=Psychromonas sp. TaxID=1884585 RepID=UPI0039E4A4F8